MLASISIALLVLGCEKDDEREEKDAVQPLGADQGPVVPGGGLPPQTSTPVVSSGLGVSPDSCTQAGTAWVAAPGPNTPPACGGPLAAFKPCLEQVTARFPGVAQAVKEKHTEYLSTQQMMLYAISNENNQIVMHYVKQEGAGFQYANISFQAFSIEPSTEPPACTQDHNAVPGLNGATTGGETDGETGGDTGGDTGGETGGDTDGETGGETGGDTDT
jgi:hypothetical protein